MAEFDKDPAWWRHVTSAAELCTRAGFGPIATKAVLANMRRRTNEVDTYHFAYYDLGGMLPDVSIPRELETALDKDQDTLIRVWCALRVKYDEEQLSVSSQQDAVRLAVSLVARSSPERRPDLLRYKIPNAAFARAEKPDARGAFASRHVLSLLLRQHALYTPIQYLAPYTTLAGPSGIGKSFSVRQMAVRHGIYVAYSNLAPSSSLVFPRPVTMGETPIGGAPDKPAALWQIYLENQIRLATCCKEVGITAAGLFELLTSAKEQVAVLRDALKRHFGKAPIASDRMQTLLVPLKAALEELSLNAPPMEPTPAQATGPLPVVVCFDEARALFKEDASIAFRALQQAARAAAEKGNMTAPFFVVLLDTTSRISHCTPPRRYDPGAKILQAQTFHPIYQINSFNLFTPPAASLEDPTGSETAMHQLLAHGRPLWGAFLEAGESWAYVLERAVEKISAQEDGHAYDLSLLSYRMNVSISSPDLAEALVAGSMRYLLTPTVSGDRASLLTTQPSEPVLALAATCLLQDPSVRLRCIRSWIRSLHAGAINPGDIGEQVASLVLLFASDHASEPSQALPAPEPVSGVPGSAVPPSAIAIKDFFHALLGPEAWHRVQARHHSPSTRQMLDSGLVFFNHIIRLSSAPTFAVLEAAYKRGAALFLPTNFPGMDIAIPVRVPSGGMALFLVQVKNRQEDGPTPVLRLYTEEALGNAEKALGRTDARDGLRGIVGLVVCLRTAGHAHFSAATAPAGPETRKRTRSQANRAEAADKPTLLGMAFGLNTSMYPCLKTPSATVSTAEGAKEMEEMCQLLVQLLAQWPHAYAAEDVQTPYAQKLLNPASEL